MNDSEANHIHDEISEQIAGLQRQVFTLLLVLIVVSSTLVAYLFYQARITGKSIQDFRLQTSQLIQNSASVNRAGMDAFENQITAYGLAHPDFQPILRKYGWTPPVRK